MSDDETSKVRSEDRDSGVDDAESGATSPFDELASEVGSDPDDIDVDRLFEEMFTEGETEEIDAEWIWDELEETSVAEGRDSDGEEHIVPTWAFCAQCEHVADPPEVRCTYNGSEIVEFVDEERVRVRNCPIVARREQISEME
jgi:hypothetical protein